MPAGHTRRAKGGSLHGAGQNQSGKPGGRQVCQSRPPHSDATSKVCATKRLAGRSRVYSMHSAAAAAMVLAACLAGDAQGFALPPAVLASHRAPAALPCALCKGRWTARAFSKPNTQPRDCCGKDAERSMHLPAQGIDLPDWVDRILTVRTAYKLHAHHSAGSCARATPRPLCKAQAAGLGAGETLTDRSCDQLRRYCLRSVVFYQRALRSTRLCKMGVQELKA